ncbi:MAG: DNA internalization-related competence protein ComEC/Rec2 [Candidatus Acidiferrales bacterium]
MRLPAVVLATLFAGGIALGLYSPVVKFALSPAFLLSCFLAAGCLLFAGLFLTSLRRLGLAASAAAMVWILLGVLGACIGIQPRASDHVISLLDAGRIELKTPLRWHGKLRDEPARLPWGFGYEVELSGVDYQGRTLRARGGMRLSFTPKTDEQAFPDLHAGDEVSVLAQARRPQLYRDDGAFDRRAYLEQQNIDLLATLRGPELLEHVSTPAPTIAARVARVRRALREEIDALFQNAPQVAGVLRAMLLGDRSFVDRQEATDFQKTGVFHVLVVAGLHVGALAVFLFWAGRGLRLSLIWSMAFTLTLLFAYVAVVEQRPPVLRAAVMTALVVIGSFFFRRLDLLNSAALAALLLLVSKPLAIRNSSFQLTFVAIGCIAGLALPWLERTAQPYARSVCGWRDVTRDAAHESRQAQFRMDLRSLARWVSQKLPLPLKQPTENAVAGGITFSFRLWELFVLTIVLQIGMLPLMARDFHRITLAAPVVNLAAVPLMGVAVPLGFLTLASGLLFPALGRTLAQLLGWLTLFLIHLVQWFAHFPRWSYRIPGPHGWLVLFFFIVLVALMAVLRFHHPAQRLIAWALCAGLFAGALAIAVYPFASHWSRGKLEVTILDVGQGDSVFVVSPEGKTLLIDGGGSFGGFSRQESNLGPDPGEEAVSPYLWSRGFQKLDVVALTHAHQDHIGGLTAILENFRVSSLWIGREVNSPALKNLEELARAKKILIVHQAKGPKFTWDGVEGEFLWPEASAGEVASNAQNNDSLVLRLRYGNRAVLLPGDAERQAEEEMLAENSAEVMRADILKTGHHGSKNSTTPEFLAAVRPHVAVISAGEENPYGHPNRELLERLEQAGVRILRTDREGAVHVFTDGNSLEISCYVACPETASEIASGQAQTPHQEQ